MKVKIGKSLSRRSKVDLGFDNSTTAEFGHCQPIVCKELVPDSEYKVEVDSLVRLSPLVKPTFGRVKYKVWHNFIPIADIYKPFESMLSQTPFTTASGVEYIPTNVPQMKLSDLSKAFYCLDFFVTPYRKSDNHRLSMTSLYSNGVATVGDIIGVTKDSSWGENFSTSYFNGQDGSGDKPWVTFLREFTSISDSTPMHYENNWGVVYYDVSTNKPYSANPGNCDMMWQDQIEVDSSTYINFILCQRLTDRQRRLRKVLLGLGYALDINNSHTTVSLLPLIAYYKAWFNTLYPERYKTWTQTAAYKLMENFADYGNNMITESTTSQIALFNEFLADLADTYYFDDADYYSAHLTGTAVGFGSTSVTFANGAGGNTTVGNSSTGEYQPSLQLSPGVITPDVFSDTTIRMLRILTKFVNKNSQIGGKIAEYLRAHYGADIINNLLQNYFIGGDSTDITISDVMSNASTDGAELADYAGKGVGYKDGKTFTYKADTFGYWITFSAIVPRSRWYQGFDPQLKHRSRFEFFTPEFDAVGFQYSTKGTLVNNEGIGTLDLDASTVVNSQGFGFIPRYSEYKVPTKNIVNGDITLPSTRNDLMPYTLDKTFTPFTVNFDAGTDASYGGLKVYKFPAVNIVASNMDLRRIGYKSEYGNYDRIFYANESAAHQLDVIGRSMSQGLGAYYSLLDDNFVIHHIVNIDAKIPMIPMSESFDTGGDEDDAMTVDKV